MANSQRAGQISHLGSLELPDKVLLIAQRIRRRTIEFAYETGRDLIEAKAECNHGAWLRLLESVDIPTSTAGRMMKYARMRDERTFKDIRSWPYTKFLKAAPVLKLLEESNDERDMMMWKVSEQRAIKQGLIRRLNELESHITTRGNEDGNRKHRSE